MIIEVKREGGLVRSSAEVGDYTPEEIGKMNDMALRAALPFIEECPQCTEVAFRIGERPTCCICGEPIIGHGNNPWPVKTEGKCCDKCNIEVVVSQRIEKLQKLK